MLVNTFIMAYNYHFSIVLKKIKIWSLSNFEVYNTVLLPVITMLYIRSPELNYLLVASLYPHPTLSPGNHHSTLFSQVQLFQIPHISDVIQYLSYSI